MERPAMSLSAWEQHSLDSIQDGLTRSDPALVALLTTFSRLASDDEMPVSERIRAGSHRAIRYPRRQRRHPSRDNVRRRARRVYRRLGLQRAVLILLLLTTAALLAIALALNAGNGHGACTESWPMACAGPAPAHNPGSG
jgi:hypothetical protein